jgi:hypothetical protein
VKGLSPFFKGSSKDFDFPPKQVQIFFFLNAITFQTIAVRQDVSGHDVDESQTPHPNRVGIAKGRLFHFFGNKGSVIHKRCSNIIPKTVNFSPRQLFPVMCKVGSHSFAHITKIQ